MGRRSLRIETLVPALILAVCGLAFALYRSNPLISDVAWLIEATRRWAGGAVLYRDIVEINPPLIFYDTELITLGHPNPQNYVLGVCMAAAVSALWVLRLRGPYVAASALAAMLIGGLADFGQRGHLPLIFLFPMLVAKDRSPRESVALGMWAFLGAGLKPTLVLIPLASVACTAVSQRSIKPFLSPDLIVLLAASAGYVVFVAVAHPLYFSSMVPLGRFVYGAYGAGFRFQFVLASAIVVAAALTVLRSPIAWASVAALGNYYFQGRGWSYHLVPAIGLALFLCLTEFRRSPWCAFFLAPLLVFQINRGPPQPQTSAIPANAKSVAVLCAHLYCAYPRVVELGIRNSTRYPSLWTLPGAWNIATDPRSSADDRKRAVALLRHERAIIRHDILSERPEYIIADIRPQKPYFERPFDYIAFLGPFPAYVLTRQSAKMAIWKRAPRASLAEAPQSDP